MLLLHSHHKRIHSLAYSADGSTLYAVVSEWNDPHAAPPADTVPGVELWHLDGGEPEYLPDSSGRVRPVRFLTPLPDGRVLTCGEYSPGRAAFVVDSSGTRPPIPLDVLSNGYWPSVAVSPTGDRLAVAGIYRGGILAVFALPVAAGDLPTFMADMSGSAIPTLRLIEFHPDGERLLSVELRRTPERSSPTFCWRNAADGSIVPWRGRMADLPGRTVQAKLAAGGSRLLVRYANCLVSYDTARPTRDQVRIVSESTKHFTDMAVHPDGRRVFATCNDTTVREFDAVTLQEFKGFGWQIGRLRCVAIAPDGLTAAAGSDAGKVIVWDLE